MLKKLILSAAVLTLSSLALAQHKSQQQTLASPDGVVTPVCKVTFSSGTGSNATKWCVTENGTIAQFSVAGQEMIAVETIGEGYGICDLTGGGDYFDYGYENSGNWGSPSFSIVGNNVTVTRSTNDGIWTLKQVITNVPANGSGPGSVKVSMALTNLSGINRGVNIVRYADVDADGDVSGNDCDFTNQTSFCLEPSFNRGLGGTNGTFNASIYQTAFAQGVFDGPDPCDAGANLAPQPFQGDGSVGQFWEFTDNHHATKTVVMTYKPI